MMNFLKKKIGSSKILPALMIGSIPFISACSDNDLAEGSLGASLDITSTIVFNENFSILEQALIAADLAGTLSSEGPFTVFAPNDTAFQALLDSDPNDALATPADLLALPNLGELVAALTVPVLTDVLAQHFVPGLSIESQVAFAANGSSLPTLRTGKLLPVLIEGGELKIGGSTVTVTNIIT